MTQPIRQSEYADLLRAEIAGTDARLKALAQGLDQSELDWAPPEGGWGIGQVLEHLCIANDSYLDRIRVLVGRARAPSPEADPVWRPSVMGRWVVRAFQRGRRLPAPPTYRPAFRARPRVLEELLRRQRELVELLGRAVSLQWSRIRTGSPVTSLIRLNLGDCFTIVVAHERRHLRQLERIRARADFPVHHAIAS